MSLLAGERVVGDLRMEAYDTYSSFDLRDANGDDVLETVVFYGQDENVARNLEELLSVMARLRDREASPAAALSV